MSLTSPGRPGDVHPESSRVRIWHLQDISDVHRMSRGRQQHTLTSVGCSQDVRFWSVRRQIMTSYLPHFVSKFFCSLDVRIWRKFGNQGDVPGMSELQIQGTSAHLTTNIQVCPQDVRNRCQDMTYTWQKSWRSLDILSTSETDVIKWHITDQTFDIHATSCGHH